MLGKLTKRLLPLSLSLALSGCTGIEVPDTTACAVAGQLSAGMDCERTLSDFSTSMNLDQTVDFLEPQLERPDPANPEKKLPARGAAICQSAEDWGKLKTVLEQACHKLGRACSKDVQEQISQVSGRVDTLQRKVAKKRHK